MSSLSAEIKIRGVERQQRFSGRKPKRSRALMKGAAALSLALGATFSVATLTKVDLSNALVQRAKTLTDLLNARSPGQRTEANLSNTKPKHQVLAESNVGDTDIKERLKNFAQALAPMGPAAVNLDAPPEVSEFPLELSPRASLASPPGGVIIPLPGGTPGGPGTPPGQPPINPPSPPPLLPEPGTWMMMIVGFAIVGHALRRDLKTRQLAG